MCSIIADPSHGSAGFRVRRITIGKDATPGKRLGQLAGPKEFIVWILPRLSVMTSQAVNENEVDSIVFGRGRYGSVDEEQAVS